ncbi:MAG TPA: response regulator transcription factor [Steroidobacteraceae bacterium]|nr:response regulator transcription factor [Steroidobacteraceae bacterium]
MRVLVIEDHRDIAENIKEYLEARSYEVDIAMTGDEGLTKLAESRYDAVVLDLMLPGVDGLTICRRLRSGSQAQAPVLMLTAKDLVSDKVAGFEAGADDYLVKPFSLLELEARLKALLRRTTPTPVPQVLQIASLRYDPNTLTAERDGTPIKLNPSTRRILLLLMQNSHRVVTREELEHELWPDEAPEGDVLRAHMYALRNAIDKPFGERLLKTVHGEGYRLTTPDAT